MVSSMNSFQQNDMYNQAYYTPGMINGMPQQDSSYGELQETKTKSGPSTIGMMAIGGVGSGILGYIKNKNAIGKDGTVSDTFARKVFDKHATKNLSSNGQKFFKEMKDVLKKINKVKTIEDFKNLLNKNKMIFNSEFNGISTETILSTTNADNLKNKRKNFSKALNSWLDFNIQNMKDTISACWDKEQKKFVRPKNVDKKIFKTIKNTNLHNKWCKAGKYAAIGAGIGGVLTIGYKKLVPRFTRREQL